jgi:hypothetical protein
MKKERKKEKKKRDDLKAAWQLSTRPSIHYRPNSGEVIVRKILSGSMEI